MVYRLVGLGKVDISPCCGICLHLQGVQTCGLDGDNIRHGLCADLRFSNTDRKKNIRRVGETAKLMLETGIITLTAFISPIAGDRAIVRRLVSEGDFIKIYCYCPLNGCESRDVKGLYKKAQCGEISDFSGI